MGIITDQQLDQLKTYFYMISTASKDDVPMQSFIARQNTHSSKLKLLSGNQSHLQILMT